MDSLVWVLDHPVKQVDTLETHALAVLMSTELVSDSSEQYQQLRNVLLETSTVLLDPSLDRHGVREIVGRHENLGR